MTNFNRKTQRKFNPFFSVIYPLIAFLLLLSSGISAINIDTMPQGLALKNHHVELEDFSSCDKCPPVRKENPPRTEARSYDPHSQLLFFQEMEAGRIAFYLDAYYGHRLTIEIQNEEGEKMVEKKIAQVELHYLHVDLAAWECGTYYVLLVNGHGEVEQYSFVIE